MVDPAAFAPHTIVDALAARARDTPDRTAYLFFSDGADQERLSYGALWWVAGKVSARIREDAAPGDRVLLLFPAGPAFMTAFFGCILAGVVPVPLYPPSRRRRETFAAVIRDCTPSLVLTIGARRDLIDSVLTGIENAPEIVSVDELGAIEPSAPVEIDPDQLAFLQYTSGSTGAPKGVMVRHRDLIANQAAIAAAFSTSESDCCVSWLPLYHDMGLIGTVLHALYAGFPSILLSPNAFLRDPLCWLRAITQFEATLCGGPNFAFDLCVRRAVESGTETIDLSSLRLVFNGAEPVRAETLERFQKTFSSVGLKRGTLFPCYGMAESTLLITGATFDEPLRVAREGLAEHRLDPDEAGVDMVPCGPADDKVLIVDPQSGEILPEGSIGEIWFDGPGVTAGYWNNPDATAATFGATQTAYPGRKFLRTRDLGSVFGGKLYVTGRLADLIIIRGRNYYPQDIEQITRQAHPVLRHSLIAAIPIPGEGTERLVVIAEADRPETGIQPIAHRVNALLAEQLELRPARLVLIPKGGLPRTSSGKLRRKECRHLLETGRFSILAEYRAEDDRDLPIAGDEDPREVVAEVARLVGIDATQIDSRQPLVSLGLDSLMAAQLSIWLQNHHGIAIGEEQLLEGTTLHDLESRVEQGESITATRTLPLESDETTLSSEQHRLWLLTRLEPGFSGYHIPVVFRIRGALSGERLRRALAVVSTRHDSLRTLFRQQGLEATRVILDEAAPTFSEIDLSTCPEPGREARLTDELREEIRAPFSFSETSPWRVAWFRLNDHEHVLAFTFHHILTDLHGVSVFLDDLAACYDDPDKALPPAIPYGRLVRWQHNHLDESTLGPHLTWWRENLADLPAPLDLPLDRPRGDRSKRNAATHCLELKSELVGQLKRWSAERGVTLFTTLLTAFEAVLHRYGDLDDIPVAAPISGRPFPELEDCVGFFAYPLIVRTRLTGATTLNDLLERVHRALTEARRHAIVPPARIMEAVRPTVSPAWHPLYQVMFSFFDRPTVWSPVGLESRHVPMGTEAGDLDLFLTLIRDGEGLEARLETDPDLFDEETAVHLAEWYGAMLETLVTEPTTPLVELALPASLETRKRAARERDRVDRLLVAGNFTVEPIEDSLRFWLEHRGRAHEIIYAPYNQVFTQLMDPKSELNRSGADFLLLLIRLEDWVGSDDDADLERNIDDLLNSLERNIPPAPLLLCLCPATEPTAILEEAGRRLLEEAARLPGIWTLNAQTAAETYDVEEVHNPHTDREAHIPYTTTWFAAMGTMAVRWMESLQRQPFKVIALDCDHTLWSGVIGESRPDELVVDGPYGDLQRFMASEKDKGRLLALVSKNNEDDVREVFSDRTDMGLTWGDIAAHRINWDAKSANLAALAEELSLGIDSFLFVDDNPIEIAEVAANRPEVTTIALPADPAEIPAFLKRHWAFDQLGAGEVDRRRTQMVLENRDREQARRDAPTPASFLAGLELEIAIRALTDIARAAQLSLRTNQFRCHDERLDAQALSAALADGAEGYEIAVRDRFGDYGIVGQMLTRMEGDTLVVSSFLLSCRALGRGVEHRMAAHLGERARTHGKRWVEILFTETDRNLPAQSFLAGIEGAERSMRGYRIPTERAVTIALNPETEITEPSVAPAKRPAALARAWEAPAADIMNADAATLLERIREAAAVRMRSLQQSGSATTDHVAPTTALQKELAEMFSELLGLERVSIHDNFMAKGGYSIQGIKLITRIQEFYGIELPLALFFEEATVASLAENIERLQIEQADSADFDRIMSEMEGLSDEEIQALLAEPGHS